MYSKATADQMQPHFLCPWWGRWGGRALPPAPGNGLRDLHKRAITPAGRGVSQGQIFPAQSHPAAPWGVGGESSPSRWVPLVSF